jgi:hypothetical protein
MIHLSLSSPRLGGDRWGASSILPAELPPSSPPPAGRGEDTKEGR